MGHVSRRITNQHSAKWLYALEGDHLVRFDFRHHHLAILTIHREDQSEGSGINS
jgi:hypothetical protein